MDTLQLTWTSLAIPLLGGAGLSIALSVRILRDDRRHWGAALLLGSGAWWSVAYALELLSVGLEAKSFFCKVAYAGIGLLPFCSVVSAAQYADCDRWITRRSLAVGFAITLVPAVAALTNGLHGAMWRSAWLNQDVSPAVLMHNLAWGFWVFAGYAAIHICAAFGLAYRALQRAPGFHRHHMLLLHLCIGVLVVALLMSRLNLGPGAYLDIVPFVLPIIGLVLVWGLRWLPEDDAVLAPRSAAFEHLPDAMIVLDVDGRILDLNQVARQILETDVTTASGRHLSVCYPSLAERLGMMPGRPPHFETEVCLQDADQGRIHDVRVSPLADDTGGTVGYVVALRDVTEIKQGIRLEQQRHRYLQALWTALPDAVVVLDPDHTVQAWNAGAEQLLDCSAEEAVGARFFTVADLAERDCLHIRRWLAEAPNGTRLSPMQVSCLHRTSRKASLIVAGSPATVDGSLIAVVMVFADITELRDAEASLRMLNEVLEERVADRTAELLSANQKLAAETSGHRRAADALLQRNRELLSLQAAATATGSSLDLAFVLETVTWEMVDLLAAVDCVVYEWHPDRNEIAAMADYTSLTTGKPPREDAVPLSERPLHLRTLQERYAQILSLADDMPSAIAGGRPAVTGYLMLLPMVFQEHVVGLVEVRSDEGSRGYGDRDVSLGQLLANQAAIAIEHARLYERAQHEIAERERAEQQLKVSLREKETLLQEIHHRVKNNLQVVSSLLNLQARAVNDPETVEALKESQNRLRSMSLIHERLYRSENLAQIDFAEYLRGLTAYLVRSYRSAKGSVAVGYQLEDIHLSIERAVPCGLIVNELVSNALKYAFPEGQPGRLEVGLAQVNSHVRLTVSDDGVGLPEGIDIDQLDSLGLQLVHMLVDQLGGQIQINTRHGTAYEIHFAA